MQQAWTFSRSVFGVSIKFLLTFLAHITLFLNNTDTVVSVDMRNCFLGSYAPKINRWKANFTWNICQASLTMRIAFPIKQCAAYWLCNWFQRSVKKYHKIPLCYLFIYVLGTMRSEENKVYTFTLACFWNNPLWDQCSCYFEISIIEDFSSL